MNKSISMIRYNHTMKLLISAALLSGVATFGSGERLDDPSLIFNDLTDSTTGKKIGGWYSTPQFSPPDTSKKNYYFRLDLPRTFNGFADYITDASTFILPAPTISNSGSVTYDEITPGTATHKDPALIQNDAYTITLDPKCTHPAALFSGLSYSPAGSLSQNILRVGLSPNKYSGYAVNTYCYYQINILESGTSCTYTHNKTPFKAKSDNQVVPYTATPTTFTKPFLGADNVSGTLTYLAFQPRYGNVILEGTSKYTYTPPALYLPPLPMIKNTQDLIIFISESLILIKMVMQLVQQ
ncbi:MAG: hypothetical protein WCP46_05665 [Alphaproteobacteria bacterium]